MGCIHAQILLVTMAAAFASPVAALGKTCNRTHIRQRRIKTYHHQIANFRNPTTKSRRYRTDNQISKHAATDWSNHVCQKLESMALMTSNYYFKAVM